MAALRPSNLRALRLDWVGYVSPAAWAADIRLSSIRMATVSIALTALEQFIANECRNVCVMIGFAI